MPEKGSRITGEAAGTVDTDQAFTGAAGILLGLTGKESIHAHVPDLGQVPDHAHPIVRTVPLVQLLQSFTGHIFTFVAEMRSIVPDCLTGTDDTPLAGRGFIRAVFPASRASLPLTLECQAQATVHATGSNQPGS